MNLFIFTLGGFCFGLILMLLLILFQDRWIERIHKRRASKEYELVKALLDLQETMQKKGAEDELLRRDEERQKEMKLKWQGLSGNVNPFL